MAIKIKDSNGKWITLSQDALETPILDLGNNFDSKNVEGALQELATLHKTRQDSDELRALIGQNSRAISGLDKRLTIAEADIADLKEFGGGGGGGGLLPTIESTFEDCSIEKGESIEIPLFFSTPNGGDGVAYINVNNVEVDTASVKQGNSKITVSGSYLTSTINEVSIYVRDRAGVVSNLLSWTVICGGITLTTTFNYEADYGLSDEIKMPYKIDTPMSGEIILHLTVDGTTYEIPSINGQNSYMFNQLNLSLGSHSVSMYASVGTYTSKTISFNLVIVSTDILYLTSTFDQEKEYEYGSIISVDYRLSKASSESFDVTIVVDGTIMKEQSLRVGSYAWTIPIEVGVGTHEVKIIAQNSNNSTERVELVIFVIIKLGDYTPVLPYSVGLLCDLNASGKSNLDVNSNIWFDESGHGHNAKLVNFNFSTNGFINDELVCDNDAYVELPWSPWADNAKNGSTIDLIYSPINSGVEEARVIDYTFVTDAESSSDVKPFKGIFADVLQTIGASASSGSQAGKVNLDDESGDIHLTWVLDRSGKYFKIYVNGVLSRFMNLTDSGDGVNKVYEDFAHNNYVYLNSNKGEVCGTNNIKRFRVYDHALTSDQVLQNYLASITDMTEQEKQYNFNYKNSTLPVIKLFGDTTNMTHEQTVDMRIEYVSPNEEKYGMSFSTGIPNNPVRIQGTSSLQYVRKNYTIFLKDEYGVDMMYNPYGQGSAPDNVFCLKADYVESSHANNTGLAKFINDCVYDTKLPTQVVNPNFRNTINGFPVRVYMNNEDLGVYNLNYDRYSTKAFGYDTNLFPDMLVYEINSNSDISAGAFYRYGENAESSANITELEYYKRDFNLIFGNRTTDNDSYSEIKSLVEWVSVAEQDLFRDAISEHFDREYLFRYYLTVLLIGGVDSLGKNCKLFTVDGRIWYPLFYDIDTCLGIDNSGFLTIQPDVEIEAGSFNTSGSKLWSKVWEYFNAEIKAEWELMRKGDFNLDNIMSYIYGQQISQIPPKMYNDDAQIKYLDFGTTYVHCCHGSKEHLIKRWLRERIEYVDSMMGYFVSQDDQITIRTNREGYLSFDVTTYIPLYFSVKWSNAEGGTQTFRIGRGETKTFYYTSTTATDQEVLLPFAKYIKRLDNLSNLRPSSCILNNAVKLNNIEIHSDRLYNINVTNNKFLKTIDLKDCPTLGTVQATGSILDLSNCKYLKYGDFRNTSLTEINLNSSGGSLREIYYPNTIQNVQVIKQPLLHTLALPYVSTNLIPVDEIDWTKYMDSIWKGYDGYLLVNPSKEYILFSKSYDSTLYLTLETYTKPTSTGGDPVFKTQTRLGYINYLDNPQTFTFDSDVYAVRLLTQTNHTYYSPETFGTLVFREKAEKSPIKGMTSLYNVDLQDCPNIERFTDDEEYYDTLMPMCYCNNLTLKNSIKNLEELDTNGFRRLTNLVIENMNDLQNIGFKNLIVKGEEGTIKYIGVSNCPLLEEINFSVENTQGEEYELKFSNDAVLNFGTLYTLRRLSSNAVLDGVETIVVPTNIEKIELIDEIGGENVNTVDNIWSANVCSVSIDGALVSVTHRTKPSYKGLDLTGNTIIDTFKIQQCVDFDGVLDLTDLDSLKIVDLKGTSIPEVELGDSCKIKNLYLPSATEHIVLKNQNNLTTVDIESTDNIETICIENITSFNPLTLVGKCPNAKKVRLMGLDCVTPYTTLDLLMTMMGMKANGEDCGIGSAVSGKVTIARCSESQLASYRDAFPLVDFTVNQIVDTLIVTFKDGDGKIIHTVEVTYGATATIPSNIVPTKTSDAQYDYEWTGGWDRQLSSIMADTVINATFRNIIRYYTIIFLNPETGEIIDSQYLAYGSMPIEPTLPSESGLNYWGYITVVTGDKTYEASYIPFPEDLSIFEFIKNGNDAYECRLKSVANLPSTIVFPFRYEGKYVTKISGIWNSTGKENITNMFIPSTVQALGESTFAYCTNLSIDNVIGLLDNEAIWKNLGSFTFFFWKGLTHLEVPKFSHNTPPQGFLKGCTNLVYVNAPSWTDIGVNELFYECNALRLVCFGCEETPVTRLDLSSSTFGTIYHQIYAVLTTADGTNSCITNAEARQYNKSYATTKNAKAVKTANALYAEIEENEAILIKVYDKQCVSYDLSNVEGSGREASYFLGDNAFEKSALEYINFPNKLEYIGTSAFRDCTSLKEVNLNKVKRLATHCFYGTGLEVINAPCITDISANDCFGYVGTFKVGSFGSKEHPVTNIHRQNTFRNTVGTMALTTANGLLTDITKDFADGDAVWNYYITKENTTSVKTENECYIEINDDANDKVLLTKVLNNVEEYDLSNVAGTGKMAFILGRDCFMSTSLSKVDVPIGCTQIRASCFRTCRELKTINLPQGLEYIGAYAFYQCSNLEYIDVPNTVVWRSNDSEIFRDCTKLKLANIPSLTNVPPLMFYYCPAMKVLCLGSSSTPVTKFELASQASVYPTIICLTTANGVETDINSDYANRGTEDNKWRFYFTKNDTKAVSTENELYVELNDGVNDDKAILVECYDKTITAYNLFDIADSGRIATQRILNSCFQNCTSLKNIVVPEGVERINDWCFRDCSALEGITLPNTLNHIGSCAFMNCKALKKIDIPKNVHKLYQQTFEATPNLVYVNAPGVTDLQGWRTFESSGITMGTFGSKEYPVEKFWFKKNTVFPNSTSAKIVITTANGTVDDLKVGEVVEGDNTDLTEPLPSQIRIISENSKCVETTNERYIEIGDDGVILVKVYDNTITEYDLTNIGGDNRSAIEIMQGVFKGFRALVNVTMSNLLEMIGAEAFRDCANLKEIILPSRDVKLDWSVFHNCINLERIYNTENIIRVGEWCFGGCTKLSAPLNLPKVQSIPKYVFADSNVYMISFGSMEYPVKKFEGQFTTGWHHSNFASNGMLFLVTENGQASDVENVNHIQNLPVYYSTMDISICETENEMYAELNDGINNNKAVLIKSKNNTITEYDLTNVAGEGRTAYGMLGANCFRDHSNLKKIVIPEGVTKISSYAFANCTNLMDISLPQSLKNLGNGAFAWDKFVTIELPDSLEKIGISCFESCTNLTAINIPNGITTLENSTFINCRNLRTLTGGLNVESLGQSVFQNTALLSINLPKCSILENASLSTAGNGTYTLGSVGHPVTSIGTNAFWNLYNSTITLYTVTGDETALSGSPWGANSTSIFIYEIA